MVLRTCLRVWLCYWPSIGSLAAWSRIVTATVPSPTKHMDTGCAGGCSSIHNLYVFKMLRMTLEIQKCPKYLIAFDNPTS